MFDCQANKSSINGSTSGDMGLLCAEGRCPDILPGRCLYIYVFSHCPLKEWEGHKENVS